MSAHNFHPTYRQDIDGLRALAILPVVVYHAFPNYAPGGFVGVDIFFVISGYLISLIIFKSLSSNEFVVAEFYAHRIKRIFPALLVVTIACYAFGWFALLPGEFQQLGKHIAAGMGFVQNIVLWSEAGYFDVASELKPLMHLWSLAVEEQFYLVFPFLIWCAWKARVNVMVGVFLLGAVSFGFNHIGVHQNAVKTFFAPHTRFWELMAGSVLAYSHVFRAWDASSMLRMVSGLINRGTCHGRGREAEHGATLASVLSFIGLALVVYSIALYDRGMAYPGALALAPVLGSVLLILSGPQSWVNRQLLARKALVWVGLISYPLYLWHWPLLSFARIVEAETPSPSIRLAAVGGSFILAALTYYLIERPIRYGRSTWGKVAVLCLLALVVGLVGYHAYLREGLPFRVKSLAVASGDVPHRQEANCLSFFTSLPIDNNLYCRMSKEGVAPTISLIGDSHAASLFDGMKTILADTKESIVHVGYPGCLFLSGVSAFAKDSPGGGRENCPKTTQVALDFAIRNQSTHTVILYSRGVLNFTGKRYKDEPGGDKDVISIEHPELRSFPEIWNISLRITLDKLLGAGKKVVFVLDNPEIDFDPKSCIDDRPLRLTSRVRRPCAIPRQDFDERNKEYRSLVLRVLRDYPSVQVMDAAGQLCDEQWCWVMRDGKMLYRDVHHLSLDGARLVARELMGIPQ